MHIPDGFLSAPVWTSLSILGLAGVSFSLKTTRQTLQQKNVPLIGIMAAFIFAAQMFNFPILAGTSGHLLGACLLSVILGPWIGSLVLSIVLIIQCLLFQDGGVTALGANIINMAFIGVFVSYFIYDRLQKILPAKYQFSVSVASAAFISVLVSSLFCTLELSLSGTVPFHISIIPMTGIHALIGLGEAAITLSILSFIKKVRPDLLINKGLSYV